MAVESHGNRTKWPVFAGSARLKDGPHDFHHGLLGRELHGEFGLLLVHSGAARISIRNGQPARCANYTDSPAWIRWQSSCTTVAHVARENVHPSKRCRRSRARPDPSPRAGRRFSAELGTQETT